MTGPNFSSVNDINSSSNKQFPNSSSTENQHSPEVLNSVFQDVLKSGHCVLEDTPYTKGSGTITCKGGQIIPTSDGNAHVRVYSGKGDSSSNNFQEYFVSNNNPEVVECKNQDNKPCQ